MQAKDMEVENGVMQEKSMTDDETLVLNMEDKWKELMDLSVTGTTFEDLKVDQMREVFFNTGWSFVIVNKIGCASFLVTIEDKEYENEMNWNDVSMWVESHNQTRRSDLIIPRVAWLNISRLPYIVANNQVLESLVSPVGSFKRQVFSNDGECSLPSIKVYVIIRYGKTIKTTRKVRLENQLFMVSINEVESVGKIGTGLGQRM